MTDDDGGRTAGERPGTGELGGEAACSLHRVCPECGALNDTPQRKCWRCGDVVGPLNET